MPLVILESADGGGKTTLANRLLKGTGKPTLLVKRSGPPGDLETLGFMTEWISQQARHGLNIIADRHPLISEAIYAPIVRKVAAPPWTLEDVARAMTTTRTEFVLIYCRTWTESMLAGSQVEEQMKGVHENYDALVAEYDRWMDYLERAGVPLIRYDYRKDPVANHMTDYIRTFWENARDR